ncbi:MAG: universal stress protein [Paludibacter sp.]|nr:universal stress protein [Paludibacter sp.]
MKTKEIKKVLIAMDYDETSQKVAEQGFSMAKAMNAEVILLHVISEQYVYYSEYSYMRELQVDYSDDLEDSSQKFLNKTRKYLGDESIRTIIKLGGIAETILETAKDLNADIIVIGSHSRNWLENIFLGSQAQDLLKKSTLPLLIIPTEKPN